MSGFPPSLIRRVVVTGIGAVTPLGHDAESFWQGAREGRSGVRGVEGFDASDLDCRIAAQVRGFEARALPDENDRPSPPRPVPLALAAAAEALGQAGLLQAGGYRGRSEEAAVVIGSGGGAFESLERQFGRYHRKEAREAPLYSIPSATTGAIPSAISAAFGIRGMSHVLSDGCTSSTDAIGYAFRHVRHAAAEVVVTGGVDATITHAGLLGFCQLKVLAAAWNDRPEEASRPFDRGRDGFVLGEGAWMLVLEELQHARRRGAKILGEVLGYGATCDARHGGRRSEDGAESARAISLALAEAALHPEAVDYVSLHGASTRVDDVLETRAVKRALGDHARRVPMSALKSMIGHPQGASGAAGVVATLLSMRDGFVHPTVNLDSPDPECDLDYVARIGRAHAIEVAICNCVGLESGNAALALRRWHA